MENISTRIKQYADIQRLPIRQIEVKIGASNGVISSSISKNTDIQSKWLSKIIEHYPDINPTWLLTGKGEMLVWRAESEAKQPAAAPAAANSELVAYLERQMAEMKREIQEKDRTIWDLEAKIEGLACELRRRKEAPAEDHPLADVG